MSNSAPGHSRTQSPRAARYPCEAVVVPRHPFESMTSDLWEASAASARHAIGNYDRADAQTLRAVAMSAGAAVEHLLMACVASIDTLLLADRADAYSAYHLSRGNRAGNIEARRVRTITWGAAVAILEVADASATTVRPDIKLVMDSRNAAAHIALADPEDVTEAVTRLTRVVQAMHPFLPQSEADYWGTTYLPVAQSLRDARTSAVERKYKSKVASHAERFKQMLPGFSRAEREAVYVAMEGRSPWQWDEFGGGPDHTDSKSCPACSRRAHIGYGIVELDDFSEVPRIDENGEENGTLLEVAIELVPLALECPVCGLELDAEEVALVPGVTRTRGKQWMDLPWSGDDSEILSVD